MPQLRQRYMSLMGGMNPDMPPIKNLGDYVLEMKNWEYDEGGNIVTRKGSARLLKEPLRDSSNNLRLPVYGIFEHRNADDSRDIIVFAGTYSFIVDPDAQTATVKQTGLAENTVWTAGSYSGSGALSVFIATNGTDKIQRYDTTNGWTTLDDDLNGGTVENIPYAKVVKAYKDHVFVFPIRFDPSDDWNINHIRYSPLDWDIRADAGMVPDWKETDDIGSEIDDKSEVTAAGEWADSLYFFTADDMLRLVGTSNADFYLEFFEGKIGCVSHNTVQATTGGLLWRTKGGIARFVSGIPEIISMGRFARFWRMLDEERAVNSCAVFYRGRTRRRNIYKIWATITFENETIAYNNIAFVYDIDMDAWSTATGQEADCCCTGEINEVGRLYFGNRFGIVAVDDEGYIDVGYHDQGEPIEYDLIGGGTTFGDIEEDVVHTHFDLFYNSKWAISDFAFKYTVDTVERLDSDGNAMEPHKRTLSLERCAAPMLFGRERYTQKAMVNTMVYKQMTVGINAVGRNLFWRIQTRSQADIAIHGLTIRGNPFGMLNKVR